NAAVIGFHDRPDTIALHRGDGDANDAQRSLRQALVFGDFGPVVAAIGALPQAGTRTAAFETIRCALHSPHAGIRDTGIARIENQIDRAHLFVDEQHLLPGGAAVFASIDAALLIRPIKMSERSGIYCIRIARVDANARDMTRVLESDVLPGVAGIVRFP